MRMTRRDTLTLAAALLIQKAAGAQQGAVVSLATVRAFDLYEQIRLSLTRDGLVDVATNAATLAPLAGEVAGKDAETAANRVRAAKTLAVARDEFGNLSLLLVPKFLEAELPGVVGYACSMKPNAVWAQRGETLGNPYFGKVMIDCGARIRK
jgi:hypothetical protein